jgi:hypothetical protein
MADLLTLPALPTFRDPAGSVEIWPDGAYRGVRAPFGTEILDFLASPIATELVEQGRLVASEVLSPPTAETLVLKFQELLCGRDAIYTHITEAAFRKAFGEFFTTVNELALANGRIMLHLRKR